MDYAVSGRTPDVAQAVVNHVQNADGTVSPQSATVPAPVAAPLTLRTGAVQTVTTASAYSSGNVVGGKITFGAMVRAAGQGGVITAAIVRDKAGQPVPYDLILFDADPTNTTVTDKSAVAVNTADLAKVIGVVQFSGVVLGAASTMGVFTTAPALGFKLTSGTSIFGILVTRGTPIYAGTSDVSVDLIVSPD